MKVLKKATLKGEHQECNQTTDTCLDYLCAGSPTSPQKNQSSNFHFKCKNRNCVKVKIKTFLKQQALPAADVFL